MKSEKLKIPINTLERLVIYQRLLRHWIEVGTTHVFSHQMARLAHNSPVQVRRDLMQVGCSGSSAKGYAVRDLYDDIHRILARDRVRPVALAGVGDFGRAILAYCRMRSAHLPIVAAFDNDPARIGRVIAGCRCYDVREMAPKIAELGIEIGMITVPSQAAQEVADRMASGGVKGILNFTSVPLRVPGEVEVEDFDIGMKLEKIAFLCQ